MKWEVCTKLPGRAEENYNKPLFGIKGIDIFHPVVILG
jgi:hypothetical protein